MSISSKAALAFLVALQSSLTVGKDSPGDNVIEGLLAYFEYEDDNNGCD